jgi:hypothetical protein
MWPWLFEDQFSLRSPEAMLRLRAVLIADEGLIERAWGQNPEAVFMIGVIWGAFSTVRQRRTWEAPRWQDCPICGETFYGGEPPIWTYRQFGPSRYCTSCCFKARNGNPDLRRKD